MHAHCRRQEHEHSRHATRTRRARTRASRRSLAAVLPAQLNPQSAALDHSSSELVGSHRFYKARLARCVALEDRLQAIVALRCRYPSLPALPCPAAGDAVTIHPVPIVPGVLDACDDFWTPLEHELSVGIQFECESQAEMVRVAERIIVIDALKDLHLNEELNTLRKEHALKRFESRRDFQRKEKEENARRASASAAAVPRTGAQYFHGVEMASLGSPGGRSRLSGERSLTPSEAAQLSIRSVCCPAPDWHAQRVLCGMLPVDQQAHLSRMVFRLSRGNALVRFSTEVHRTVGTSSTVPGAAEPRVVFFIVFLGQHLASGLRRLCEQAQATLYELPHVEELEEAAQEADEKRRQLDFSSLFDRLATAPADDEEHKGDANEGCVATGQHHSPSASPLCERNLSEIYRNEIEHLNQELADRRVVATKSARALETQLAGLFVAPTKDATTGQPWSPLLDWLHVLNIEKVLCATMLQSHISRGLVTIEGWILTAQLKLLQDTVRGAVSGRELQGAPSAMLELNPAHPLRAPGMPPTHFPLNKFTSAFQALVSTYGVPRYREINPALFTITTFPFLFGLMWGDIGHGFGLLCVALILLALERRLEQSRARGTLNEILLMLFEGRYVLLCMSAWSLYVGLIYNDLFGLPIRLFPSVWSYDAADPERAQMIPDRIGHVYPLGIDPSWHHSVNEMAFYNSFKMKLSVIVGVMHMMFGLSLGLANHVSVRDWIGTFFEGIPRLLFLTSLFGYMALLIVLKWIMDWSDPGSTPPNLIQAMIQMVLSPGRVDEQERLFAHQEIVQLVLLGIAFLSVPVMLCARPCWRRHKHKPEEVCAPPSELVSGSPPAGPLRASSLTNLTSSAPSSARNSHAGRASDEENDEQKEATSCAQPSVAISAPAAAPCASPPLSSPAPSQLHLSCSEESLRRSTSRRSLSPSESFAVPASFATSVVESSAPFDFSDELIHSAIHTIEFVLGTVSNTASYLRLWALSLAHQQLSIVFWNKMVLQYGIQRSSVVGVIGFACWFAATVSVLMCMDVLECFLHALRLHWVEFQNKFFAADGVEFTPRTFEQTAK